MPTVLVLGAGASVCVDFPTGKDLRKLLLQTAQGTKLNMAAVAAGFDSDLVETFRKKFFESQLDTIDIFLELNPKLRGLGKFLIAHQLLTLEKDDRLTAAGEKCWYKKLRELIGPSVDDLRQANLKIVTFNYDRSLEHYLYKAFRAVDNEEHDSRKLVDHLGNLGFAHMHGVLSRLNWQGSGYAYGSAYNSEAIKQAAHDMLLADENSTVDVCGAPLSKIFEDAQRVFFFGFGFHPSTLPNCRCPLPSRLGGCHYGATGIGLGAQTQQMLRSRFQITFYDDIEQVFDTYFVNAEKI